MRTAKIGLYLLLGASFMTAGCTASLKAYPFGMTDTNVNLKRLQRKDYEILGPVEGTATISTFLCFGGLQNANGDQMFKGSLSLFADPDKGQKKGSGWSIRGAVLGTAPSGQGMVAAGIASEEADLLPPPGMSEVEQAAAFNAMEKAPDADGLINVVITKGERFHIPFLFLNETVTLRATAIKIKAG